MSTSSLPRRVASRWLAVAAAASLNLGIRLARAARRIRGPRIPRPPGRNDPCPCGSGLKFKRCCAVPKPRP